jgi:uncharacterized protein with LGFP repeats
MSSGFVDGMLSRDGSQSATDSDSPTAAATPSPSASTVSLALIARYIATCAAM